MLQRIHLIGFFASVWIFSCSEAGMQANQGIIAPSPTPDSSDDDQTPIVNQTKVGFALLSGSLPSLLSCPKPQSAPTLVSVDSDFNLNGSMDDWKNISPLIIDPTGDQLYSGIDIKSIYVAKKDPDIIGAVETASENLKDQISGGGAIFIEFGGVYLDPKNVVQKQPLRLYKIDSQGFEEFVDGTGWQSLDATRASYVLGTDLIEWRIFGRELDEVFFQSVFWIRVFSGFSANTLVSDSTMSVYLNTLSDENAENFTIGRCSLSLTAPNAPYFEEIYTTEVDSYQASQAFSIVRLAYQDFSALIKADPLPVAHFSTIVSTRAFSSSSPTLGAFLDPNDSFYYFLPLNTPGLGTTEIFSNIFEKTYTNASAQFLNFYFHSSFPAAPDYLIDLMKNIFSNQLIVSEFGINYWLGSSRADITTLLGSDDAQQPVSLEQRYIRLTQPFATPADESQYAAVTNAKSIGLSQLFYEYIPIKYLLQAWQEAASIVDQQDPAVRFENVLKDVLTSNGLSASMVDGLWDAWLTDGSYQTGYDPSILGDSDSDGLPDFIERIIGTDPNNPDTDGDGWTDFAEYVLGTDPLNSASHPNGIVADGSFGDWDDLLPDQVHTNVREIAKGCPESSDIKFYGALATKTKLMIGLAAAKPWNDPYTVSWEAQLKLKSPSRTLLLRSISGQYEYEIWDMAKNVKIGSIMQAVPLGIKNMEWFIDFDTVGITTDLTKSNAVTIKVSTIYQTSSKILCDQTGSFTPVVNITQ